MKDEKVEVTAKNTKTKSENKKNENSIKSSKSNKSDKSTELTSNKKQKTKDNYFKKSSIKTNIKGNKSFEEKEM